MAVLPRSAGKAAAAPPAVLAPADPIAYCADALACDFAPGSFLLRAQVLEIHPLKSAVAAISLLLGLLAADAALAQGAYVPSGLEIRGGVLAHDVPDLWSGFRLESGVDINAELLLGSGLPILGGSIRPALGASVNTAGGTSKAYLDARWEIETPSGVFFGLGLGAAVHDGNLDVTEPDRKALGSRVLFHIPIEIGLRFHERQSISVFFEHISNGFLADRNEGLDSIGVRYGYRF
ncbi:MAG: acyloxyacyl hydrolase [Hyphomicrobiaceae bacterium]|nr:MAG: acyloxyacyl hydrolase [Hyphomicrobiaceae bacterium]